MRSVSDKGQKISAPTNATEARTSNGGAAHAASPSHVKYSGIHNRRDKRYPFRSGRVRPEDLAEAEAYQAEHPAEEPPQLSSVEPWKEALMLWLSWNSTYEKVLGRMCKKGQNQQKLESLMDEMDQLRKRAIATSERVLD